MNPFDIEASRARLRLSALVSGVEAEAGREGVVNVKLRWETLVFQMYIAVDRGPRDTLERHRTYILMSWVSFTTGNRMSSVFEALSIYITIDGIYVRWGPRKVCKRAPTEHVYYPYSWSGLTLPQSLMHWVDQYTPLARFDGARVENVAASWNSWAAKARMRTVNPMTTPKLTSACARVSICNVGLDLFAAGELSNESYELYFDHTVKEAMRSYRRSLSRVVE